MIGKIFNVHFKEEKKKFVFCYGNMNQLFLFSAIQKIKDMFFDLI